MSDSVPSSVPPALDFAFLRRTVRATIAASLLIALLSSLLYSPLWGARYVIFALWSIGFFSISGLIFKYMLFDRNKLVGFGFIALKLLALAPIFAVAYLWPIPEAEGSRAHVMAMFLGVTTPFVVLLFMVAAFALGARRPPPASDSSSSEVKSPS